MLDLRASKAHALAPDAESAKTGTSHEQGADIYVVALVERVHVRTLGSFSVETKSGTSEGACSQSAPMMIV